MSTTTTGYESLLASSSSSSTSSTTSTTTSSSSSSLSNDDFLTLLVTEMQYQDPTDPMDTETILTQTSQLASIEAAENTATALAELSSSLQSSTTFNAVSTIGKMASLGSNYTTYESGETSLEVYFPNEISDGTLSIADSDGNVVRTIDLGDVAAGESGVVSITWDGLDNDGNQVDAGNYSVSATYVDPDGNSDTTVMGVYPVEAVYNNDGTLQLKLGSQYYDMSSIVEIYEKTGA